jgi:hypothetical protein
MAYERKLRRIGLIDHKTLARCVSPELMLVDPELAERARELLREPHEANGKGNMSALGTHEFTAGMSLGLEPPLSPPVVRGPSAMMPEQSSDALPSPPPALRPPVSSADDPEQSPEIPAFPPEPEPLETPAAPPQPDPLEEQTLMAPAPLAPVQPNEKAIEPKLPAIAPELPSMAPEVEPARPAIAAEEPTPAPAPELTPPPAPAPVPAPEPLQQPAEVTELQPATLTPPAPTPVETPAAAEPAPPAVELPVIELTPPAAPEALPEELPSIDLTPPAPTPAPAPEPAQAPTIEPAFITPQRGVFKVVVRLKEGDGVEVGTFPDFGTAMEGAQEVIEQFANANGSWPFYAGRFIRPDLIISVDVVEA